LAPSEKRVIEKMRLDEHRRKTPGFQAPKPGVFILPIDAPRSWVCNMEKMIYDGNSIGIKEVFDLHAKGISLHCPKCFAVLIVVLSADEAKPMEFIPEFIAL
jgi:hypothetical protein